MSQLTFIKKDGKFLTKQEVSTILKDEGTIAFMEKTMVELTELKDAIENGKLVMGVTEMWWYCNHIENWDNDIPNGFEKEFALKRLETAIKSYSENIRKMRGK